MATDVTLLVTGSRTWQDSATVRVVLANMKELFGVTRVVTGGARGADRLAEEEASRLGLTVVTHNADWNRLGKAAGPIRNQMMLAAEQPQFVVAFWNGRSRGTQDMIARARKAHKRVYVFKGDGSVNYYTGD